MTPYDAPMIGAILKNLPDDLLAKMTPDNFRKSPATVVIKPQAISEMITNERNRRMR